MNIVDPILFQCRINAEQPAICAPGTKFDLITYAQLEYMINNLTRALLPLGFEPGQVVGILLQDKIFHIALVLALTRIGIVTVSCRGPSLPKELGAAAVDHRCDHAVHQRRADHPRRSGVGQRNRGPRHGAVQATGEELCRIILTSGSTGSRKAIAFSHDKLIAEERAPRLLPG